MITGLHALFLSLQVHSLKVSIHVVLWIFLSIFSSNTYSFTVANAVDRLGASAMVLNHDTARVDELLTLCNDAINASNFKQASTYIEDACEIAFQLKYKYGMLACHNQKGLIHYHLGEYPDALKEFKMALTIAKETGDRRRMADIYSNAGMVHCETGNYPKAIENYTIALHLRDESDKRGKSVAYTNLGITYYIQGNYSQALDYFLLSLEMDQALGKKDDIAHSLNNVGIFYEHQQNHEVALQYYNQALQLYTELGLNEGIAGASSNIGNVYKQKGKNKKALEYYLIALHVFEEAGSRPDIAMMTLNIGTIYHEQAQYDLAAKYLSTALELNRQLGRKREIATSLHQLASLNTTLHQYEDARLMYIEALAISNSISTPDLTQNLLVDLSKLDSITGNYADALHHYKAYIRIKDSIDRQSNDSLIVEMQGKFESAQKDKEIAILAGEQKINSLRLHTQSESIALMKSRQEKLETDNEMHQQQVTLLDNEKKLQFLEITQNENQLSLLQKEQQLQQSEANKQRLLKNYFIVGLVLVAVMAFFIFGYFNTRQKLKMQLLRNKIAIDLHDHVGSTLSSISIFSQMARQQSKDVIPLLDSIGESSRKMLDAMADIVWTINPENDEFEKIILRMRSFAYELLGAKNIEFEFTAEEDISMLKLPMDVRKNLYLIFKEATNNLVKYAEANKATFAIKEDKNILSLMIRDNGKGFDVNRSTEGNGIKNMKKRAEEIGGRLSIFSEPGSGTTIQLNIAV